MTIALDNGSLRLAVDPAVGGSVIHLDALTEHGPVALMRPGREGEQDPNCLAMYPLVPWSNRIATGGFEWRGRRYGFAANLAGEPLPIHGDGWQRSWRVAAQEEHELRLTLRSSDQPPFDYQAELLYRLESESLVVELSVTHLGEAGAPYGLGLHPWFPRTADVRLEAPAEGVWEVDAAQLPTVWRALEPDDPWNFERSCTLPDDRIDNLFTGWGGRALLHWPRRGVRLEITAESGLSRYLIYSPGVHADFFCFEPVSHSVNAHHLGGSTHGLVELHPGQRYVCRCRFRWIR